MSQLAFLGQRKEDRMSETTTHTVTRVAGGRRVQAVTAVGAAGDELAGADG
ncbi:hypothetical protein [Micromonospora sp. NPDC007230]|uniref:hypothetical protein n=1 Tax=Micromonospora sp. NPDC007230 TaxID=3364237 RepID=UPI0036BD2167